MVTGRPPFEGTPLSVLPLIVHEEPPRPSQFRRDLDPALEAGILRALRKEPGERFQDAGAFATALAGQRAEPGSSRAVGGRTTEPVPPASVGGTARKRHGTAFRAAGWLVGDIFVLAPFLVLSALWNEASDGGIGGLICIAVPALLLATLGTCIWGIVEALYVPEGLLFFAGNNMCGSARAAIARGVPCDVQNELGETPLLLAVTKGHSEMVKVLLQNGADLTIPDWFGQTPLGVASAQGRGDMMDLMGRCAKNAVPAGPGGPPVRRWHARRRLLILAVAGALVWASAVFIRCRVEPGIGSILRMVAWSLLVVGLLPQPLIGLRGLYPFLALSARARAVAPLAQAGKTSFADPQR
jgi:hypothetical protein